MKVADTHNTAQRMSVHQPLDLVDGVLPDLLNSLVGPTIKRLVQTVVYLPHFPSWVIVVALFQHMLGDTGVVNGWLGDAGLGMLHVIGNPDAFKPLVVAQVIWKECGWGTIIFLRLGEFLSIGFEQFFLQRQAVGPEAGEVLDTFVYYTGFTGGNFGYAAAAGLFKGFIGVVLVVTANKVAHRLGEQGVYQS